MRTISLRRLKRDPEHFVLFEVKFIFKEWSLDLDAKGSLCSDCG